ncbi:hypothetical protein BGX27_005454, partial [Mortierella sp. AM989]
MMTFIEYVVADNHKHPGFDSQYSCYIAFIGRKSKHGDPAARDFKPDFETLKKEYEKIKLDKGL